MSKPSLDSLTIARKGQAVPAASTGAPVEPRTEIKEPRNQETKKPLQEGRRRRAWDGQDGLIKVNYSVPERVQTKLHELKNWKRIKSIQDFVAQTLERALDKEIAAAEKEGF